MSNLKSFILHQIDGLNNRGLFSKTCQAQYFLKYGFRTDLKHGKYMVLKFVYVEIFLNTTCSPCKTYRFAFQYKCTLWEVTKALHCGKWMLLVPFNIC